MTIKIQTNNIQSLQEEAHSLREDILNTLFSTGGGHYGGCLSVIDILLTLYRRQLRIDPNQTEHPDRDRLILSKGHAAIALYAVMKRVGIHNHSLSDYASFGSPLEGHPDMTSLKGIDFSSGSLGQGLSVALGMAIAMPDSQNVWVVLGDGECQEGQIWEAAMLAGNIKCNNLKVIIDNNKFQEWGWQQVNEETPPPIDKFKEKWESFGWNVIECEGHNFEQLESSFENISHYKKGPSVLIANTIKGKGVKMIEHEPKRFHCNEVTTQEHTQLMKEFNA